jgi:hypothetical protein
MKAPRVLGHVVQEHSLMYTMSLLEIVGIVEQNK